MIAEEALFLGAPVAHVVAYYVELRARRYEAISHQLAKAARSNLRVIADRRAGGRALAR